MRLRLQTLLLFPVLLALLVSTGASAQITSAPADTLKQKAADSTTEAGNQATSWTERRLVGTVLSVLIPGAGQTYLGHTEKGAAFTLGTLACGLMTGLSENNIVGRNERLNELKAQYKIATNYVGADTIWTKMVSTKSILDDNVSRRNLFLKLTVAFWVANMVDVILFSDDKGEKPFGMLDMKKGTTFALVPDPKNGINAVLSVRF